jgi:hypothetical protein
MERVNRIVPDGHVSITEATFTVLFPMICGVDSLNISVGSSFSPPECSEWSGGTESNRKSFVDRFYNQILIPVFFISEQESKGGRSFCSILYYSACQGRRHSVQNA